MDEPTSALDPMSTARVEELIAELRTQFSIVIVTHAMQQAARVSQRTPFATVTLAVPTGWREVLDLAVADLRAAGRVTGTLEIMEEGDTLDPQVVTHEFEVQ